MRAERLPDGRIQIPTSEETADGDLIHGTQVVDATDPRYKSYDAWLRQEEDSDG
jgi:hypothetical protein